MTDYAIFRHFKFNKSTGGFNKLSGSSNHCARQILNRTTGEVTPDIPSHCDPSKTHLNRWFIDKSGSFDVRKSCEMLIPAEHRKNAVLALECMVTASHSFFDDKTDDDIKAWVKASLKGVAACYGGKKNIVSAVLHMDENTPHLHVHVVPLINGRLNAREFCAGKAKCSQLQTTYYEHVKDFGLTRGKIKSEAKHTDIREFYGAVMSEAVETEEITVVTGKKWGLFDKKEKVQIVKPEKAQGIKAQTSVLKLEAQKADDRASQAKRTRDIYKDKYLEQQPFAATSLLREIPLELVAKDLGHKRDEQDPHKWHTPTGAVSITAQKFYSWADNKGAGGALDYVMVTEGQSFKEAKETLARASGADLATVAVAQCEFKKAELALKEVEKAPPPPPERSSEHIAPMKDYFKNRGISEDVINNWVDSGRVYPQKFGKDFQLIFVHENAQGDQAFYRKNPTNGFEGWIKGSQPDPLLVNNEEMKSVDCAIVESHVDAMAHQTLHPEVPVVTTGSVSGVERCIAVAEKEHLTPVMAVDNDDAGAKAIERVQERHPEIQRTLPPDRAKDWAEYTENQKEKEIAQNEEMKMTKVFEEYAKAHPASEEVKVYKNASEELAEIERDPEQEEKAPEMGMSR